MSRKNLIGSIAVFSIATLLFFFISCSEQPVNPIQSPNAQIYMTIQSTTLKNVIQYMDTVGNSIQIGITSNFPQFVDSVSIGIFSESYVLELGTILKNVTFSDKDPTWFNTYLPKEGLKHIIAHGYIQQDHSYCDTIVINVVPRPVVTVPKVKPIIRVTGTKNIGAAQTCTLTVTAKDTNPNQAHTFYVKQDAQAQTVFTSPFIWIPPTGFAGTSTILFKVTDTDSPSYFDTQTVVITVAAAVDTSHPFQTAPTADNQNLSTKKNTALSITLTANASTGVTLSNWTVVTNPPNGTLTGTAPSLTYTPNSGFIGFDSLTFTVSDGKNTSDAAKIKINVSDLLVAPIAGKAIPDISVNKGLVASLVATVNPDANPSPTFSWFKEGNSTLVSTSQTFTISQTSYTDQARYRYAVSNSQGSDTSNWISLTVVDITPPIITLKGVNPLQMQTGGTWTDPGATALDDRDGDISASIVIDTTGLKTNIAGTYAVSYNVKDKAANAAITMKRTVNVSTALVAPIAGKAIPDISVDKGASASFLATVNAQANPSPTFSWVKENATTPSSTSQAYAISQTSYTDQGRYRYIASNSQGSDTSNWITLTVKDVTKPVIVLKGANPQSIMVGGKYTELGDSAYDDKDGIITSKVVIDTSKVKLAQIGTYQVTYSVKDSAGNADTVTRSVQINGNAPAIGTISGNKESCLNVSAVFSVSATGSQPLKYQWMKGSAAAPGNSTDSVYSITPLSTADAGSFYCVVSNGISPNAQSQNMTLTVDSPPAISSITASPSTMPVCSGSQVAFTVAATGTSPLTYSWKKNGSAIATAPNSATYTISAVAASDSGQYSCTVSNGCIQSATSSNVHLTITMPPTISAPTANTTISKIVGDTVTLTVTASGTGTLSYQWYKGSTTVGTNSSTLPIKPIAFTDSGAYTCAVSNGCGPTNSKTIVLKVNAIPITITNIAAGNYHSLILKSDGRLFGSGSNGIGQLGLGYTADQSSPILIMSGVQIIAAGTNYSLILKTGGILYACGYNGSGQLGDGTTTERHSPVQIMTGVQSFAAGGHSLILKTDGTLFACGGNFFGQFGDGSTNSDSVPKQIMTGVKSVSASIYHSLILKTDGTLFACGRNSNGQLGDGTTKNDSVPLQIMADVQSVAAGENFSLILKTDGTLLACGDNLNGDLGDGTGIERHTPVQIMTGVKAIAAGASHSLILKTNGTLYACGNNSNGQLGNGNTNNQNSPIQIMTGVQSISAGVGHSLILKTDGTLYSCGFNSSGQLGDGTIIDKDSPVNITF
jgi:alpha-tubulin suppressor-like RCC1 family protein